MEQLTRCNLMYSEGHTSLWYIYIQHVPLSVCHWMLKQVHTLSARKDLNTKKKQITLSLVSRLRPKMRERIKDYNAPFQSPRTRVCKSRGIVADKTLVRSHANISQRLLLLVKCLNRATLGSSDRGRWWFSGPETGGLAPGDPPSPTPLLSWRGRQLNPSPPDWHSRGHRENPGNGGCASESACGDSPIPETTWNTGYIDLETQHSKSNILTAYFMHSALPHKMHSLSIKNAALCTLSA